MKLIRIFILGVLSLNTACEESFQLITQFPINSVQQKTGLCDKTVLSRQKTENERYFNYLALPIMKSFETWFESTSPCTGLSANFTEHQDIAENEAREASNKEQKTQSTNPKAALSADTMDILATEMTNEINRIAKSAGEKACASGKTTRVSLHAKGVYFGTIAMRCDGDMPTIDPAQSNLSGIAQDLVIQPFAMKNNVAFVRNAESEAGEEKMTSANGRTYNNGDEKAVSQPHRLKNQRIAITTIYTAEK